MTYVDQNWGHPLVLLAGVLAASVHLWGLHSLNQRSTSERARRRRRKMWLSIAGIMVATLSVCSPLEYWSMQYFWVHMLQHISVMLAAPALYVAGAPSLALVHALPLTARRGLLRYVNIAPGARPLRGLIHVVSSARFAIISFNVVMVFWMLPTPFDFVMKSETLHVGLMLSSFLLTGILFWSKIIASYPFRPIEAPLVRVGALLVTNLIMTLVAMSVSLFSSTADYRFPSVMMVMGSMVMPMTVVTMNRLADQQIGAAILWVCGDFWCLPALIYSIHSALKNDTDSRLIDRFLRGPESLLSSTFRAPDSHK
jgi:putative membrane protein